MKLKILSNVVLKLQEILTKQWNNRILCLRFGVMYRSGFVSFLNNWDYTCILRSLQKYPHVTKNINVYNAMDICNIGLVNKYYIKLLSIEDSETELKTARIFTLDNYQFVLTHDNFEYSIEIRFTKQPTNLKDFFEPVKLLYGFFIDYTSVCTLPESETIIKCYNKEVGKEDAITPYIVPQSLHYLSTQNLVKLHDGYLVMPLHKGTKTVLYTNNNKVYLVTKTNRILFLKEDIDIISNSSLLSGVWKNNHFFAYDIIKLEGVDVRKKSLHIRLKALQVISSKLSFCTMVEYSDDLTITEEYLQTYQGVIFKPIHANYTNNRTFIYQSIEKVGIRFNIRCLNQGSLITYLLKFGKELNKFEGSPEFPYNSIIPLSREDRDFIGPFQGEAIVEFRWQNNGFIPYARTDNEIQSTKSFTKKAWKYINTPLDISFIKDIYLQR